MKDELISEKPHGRKRVSKSARQSKRTSKSPNRKRKSRSKSKIKTKSSTELLEQKSILLDKSMASSHTTNMTSSRVTVRHQCESSSFEQLRRYEESLINKGTGPTDKRFERRSSEHLYFKILDQKTRRDNRSLDIKCDTSGKAKGKQQELETKPTTELTASRPPLSLFLSQTCLRLSCSFLEYPELKHVQICPHIIEFDGAYDGKTFKQTVMIMNQGIRAIFVKFLKPSSKSFKIKLDTEAVQLLSPGFSVTKLLQYTHVGATAILNGTLPIIVNKRLVTLPIFITQPCPSVSVRPQMLDFGTMDIVNSFKEGTFVLVNNGTKKTSFSIDLREKDLELNVYPLQGHLKPRECASIKVELMSFTKGHFKKEFWIKTVPPLRVQIRANFIMPKLLLIYPDFINEFTILDFHKVYYGVEQVKSLVIRNYSSLPIMYFVMAEAEDTLVKYPTVKSKGSFQFFHVRPYEGRLDSFQYTIIQVRFCPKKERQFKKNYAECFFRIMKIMTGESNAGEDSYIPDQISTRTDVLEELRSAISTEVVLEIPSLEIPSHSLIRVCSYGEMEDPSVVITPASFHIKELSLNQSYNRVLNIRNASNYLPIALRYRKVFSIEVKPVETRLGPAKSVELTVTITPTEMGTVTKEIPFDLFYYAEEDGTATQVGSEKVPIVYTVLVKPSVKKPKFVTGISPIITNEVGIGTDNIRFNDKWRKPRTAVLDCKAKTFVKQNKSLIAFPNDRPKSLRPWTTTNPGCQTIFAGLPRIVVTHEEEYGYSPEELEFRRVIHEHYDQFCKRNDGAKTALVKSMSNYQPSKLMEAPRCLNYKSSKIVTEVTHPMFYISLTPDHLVNIQITPKHINMGKVAPNIPCEAQLEVFNMNAFDIEVFAKCQRSVLPPPKATVVKRGEIKSMPIVFKAELNGKYCIPLDVKINHTHSFNVLVLAEVASGVLVCNVNHLDITSQNEVYFVEIRNNFNVEIPFHWRLGEDDSIRIYPQSGMAPPRRNLVCVVYPILFANTKMINLVLENCRSPLIVYVKTRSPLIGFTTTNVTFENLSLNLPIEKEIILRNFSDDACDFNIVYPDPMLEGITIKPENGFVEARSDQKFLIKICVQSLASFNYDINILVQNNVHTIKIAGNTVCPVLSITPELIQMLQVPCGSIETQQFRIKNKSNTRCVVSFCLGKYVEVFDITNQLGETLTGECEFQPQEIKHFYINFHPKQLVSLCLVLPIKINGILGPPVINVPDTLNYSHYLDTSTQEAKKLPSHLPLLKINLMADDPLVTFSKLHFNFDCFTNSEDDLIVTNVSKQVQKICINLSGTNSSFHFNHHGADATNQISFSLVPEESTKISIKFVPPRYGHYRVDFALFLNNFKELHAYNYLVLEGDYWTPNIIPDKEPVCMKTIPTFTTIKYELALQLLRHSNNCQVEGKINLKTVTVAMLNRRIISNVEEEQLVAISYHPQNKEYFDEFIHFKCSCGAKRDVQIKGAARNGILDCCESYISSKAAKVEGVTQTYEEIESDIIFVLEKWLYTEGTSRKTYYKIPEGLQNFSVDIQLKQKSAGKSKVPVELPLFNLLVNFMGTSAHSNIRKDMMADATNETNATLYSYTTYRNILIFLRTQHMCAPDVCPEYLLTYSQYLIFKHRVMNSLNETHIEILNEDDFNIVSRKTWLNLIIQCYKVFVFNRLSLKPLERRDLQIFYLDNRNKFDETYTENESILLIWYEYNYEKQKRLLWPEFFNEYRKVRSFVNGFKDSLVFATATAAFCPYLTVYLKDMFTNPKENEEYIHNASRIVQAWKQIKLSFHLDPLRIVAANPIEMLMLATYLYYVLPNCAPMDTLAIEAALSTVGAYDVTLTNTAKRNITYKALFFDNDAHLFSVDNDAISIPAKKSRTVRILYSAKTIFKTGATIVFCGENFGQMYARHVVFTLMGTPNIQEPSMELAVQAKVFRTCRFTIDVVSPYEQVYQAEVCFLLNYPPETRDDMVSWENFKEQNFPREFRIVEDVLEFDEKGATKLHLVICSPMIMKSSYYLYFLNETVGDFCCKLEVSVLFSRAVCEELHVVLPRDFDKAECICSGDKINDGCPKIIKLMIPCKNNLLWKGIRNMFNTCLDKRFAVFWCNFFENATGFHVLTDFALNTLYKNLYDLNGILIDKVKYQIESNQAYKPLRKQVTISDVTSQDSIGIKIHWIREADPETEILKLKADHGKEIRLYKLFFHEKEDIL